MKAVEIKNFSWKYSDTDKPALKEINLEIEQGEFIGIVGPNEAGKTTLVSAIKTLIPRNFMGIKKGEIKVNGQNLVEKKSPEVAGLVGYVFSDSESQFTSMSVLEEIAFGLENIGLNVDQINERIKWVSEITDIEDLLEKSPYDISGGQKQRVAISSILAMQPDIIILDEPTSMIDPLGKDLIYDILTRLKNEFEMTIIVIEHDLERLAALADRMILIYDGEIVREGIPKEFFDDIDFLQEHDLKPPAMMVFLDQLRKNGFYSGKMKTSVKEIEEIVRNIYLKNNSSS